MKKCLLTAMAVCLCCWYSFAQGDDGCVPWEPCDNPNPYAASYEACNSQYADLEAYNECKSKVDRTVCMDSCVWDLDYCNCKCDGGIILNTNIPFVGRCIAVKDSSGNTDAVQLNAFPRLVQWLSRLLLSVILLLSFVLVIVGGVMIAASGADGSAYGQWKKLIMKVIIGIALLGMMGVVLRLINPNFFT